MSDYGKRHYGLRGKAYISSALQHRAISIDILQHRIFRPQTWDNSLIGDNLQALVGNTRKHIQV